MTNARAIRAGLKAQAMFAAMDPKAGVVRGRGGRRHPLRKKAHRTRPTMTALVGATPGPPQIKQC